MNRSTFFLPVVAASVALAGCMGIPVKTDQNTPLLTSVHCQTVAWAGGFKGSSPLRNSIANPLNEQRLREAIAADLQSAGLTLIESPPPGPPGSPPPAPASTAPAQCLVGYGIGQQRDVDAVYPDGWGYAYGPGFWGPGWGWGRGWGYGGGWGGWGAPYAYRQSFITIDLYEAASRKPMWHASAEQDLAGLTGDAATQRIRAAVNAIFLKFPR